MSYRIFGKKGNRRAERGSILATSALGMLSLLLAVGLGVDISHLYLAKNELQNAADAAALAGASGLDFSSDGINDATNRAVAEMNKYEFDNDEVIFTPANVRFAANLSDFDGSGSGLSQGQASNSAVAPTIRFVRVITPSSPVNIAFVSSVVGGNSLNLSATAVAGVSVPLKYFRGLPASLGGRGRWNRYDHSPASFTLSVAHHRDLFRQVTTKSWRSTAREQATIALVSPVASVTRLDPVATWIQNPVFRPVRLDKESILASTTTQAKWIRPTYPPDTNIKEGITYAQYQAGSPSQSPTHPGVAGRRVVLIPIIRRSQFDGGRTSVQIDHFGAVLPAKQSPGRQRWRPAG